MTRHPWTRPYRLEYLERSGWTDDGMGDANEFPSMREASSTRRYLRELAQQDETWCGRYRVVDATGHPVGIEFEVAL